MNPVAELSKPYLEMGLSELAHSLAWFHHEPRTLVVGMNQKQIKTFDLRGESKKLYCATEFLSSLYKLVEKFVLVITFELYN